MERITKYKFTNEENEMLNALKSFFDDLFYMYSNKAHELEVKLNKFVDITDEEMGFLMDTQMEFHKWLSKQEKFREPYMLMCFLSDIKNRYTTQEQINKMIDNEEYEMLAFFKSKGLLDKMIKSLEL